MSRSTVLVPVAILLASQLLGAQEPELVDPTEPYDAPRAGTGGDAGPEPLRLSAILVSLERRVAVINGTVVREGDRLEDAVVMVITGDGVELRRGNEVLRLRLARDGVNANIRQGEPVR